jgi:hypothetical protein
MYSEDTECVGKPVWGDVKFGRIPAFLYEDSQEVQSEVQSQTMQDDAASFKDKFDHAFQYFQSRCQHHIHKIVNGKRIIPNACKSKQKSNECKHEAPWNNLVSLEWMQGPLLICKGLAKRFKLRCSGMRNLLGQMLPMRNEEWVNGTMPALCVAFAGSNSDVKPNDRLPVLAVTHEKVCKKNCIRNVHLKKATRNTQRTQSVCGYFGGYLGKRQPAGSLETKKCVDKLFTLRGKIKGHSKAQQVRSVSQRLITDLEMNSTYRGAVEVFNLCRHLKQNDVLFAECIRTFGSRVVDGRGWMERLNKSQKEGLFSK